MLQASNRRACWYYVVVLTAYHNEGDYTVVRSELDTKVVKYIKVIKMDKAINVRRDKQISRQKDRRSVFRADYPIKF